MVKILDFVTANGVPLRAVRTDTHVKFFDRRFRFTEFGQFTGFQLSVRSLLDSDPGKDIPLGSVSDWKLDSTTRGPVLAWLS